VRTIITITNEIQFKWHITGSTEDFILSLDKEELDTYFEFKYAQLLTELKQTSDAVDVRLLTVEVDVE